MTQTEVRLSRLIAPAYAQLHRDVRAMNHAEYWLRGGRGSGKSSFIALEILLGLLCDPLANAVVCRKVGATIRESVFEQLLWAAEALGVRSQFETRAQPHEMILRATGQRILFRGADNPEKAKSLKIARGRFAFLWFEELSEFTPEDVRSIKASVLRGEPCLALASYNPPASPAAWVNAEAAKNVPGRLVHTSTYLDLPPSWLGAAFLREAELLREENQRAFEHMYLGQAVGSDLQVFENLELRPLAEEELRSFDRLVCGLDFGFANDPDAFVRMHFDPKRACLVLVDEFVKSRLSANELAREVRQRMPCGERLVCDSAEPRALQALRDAGVRAETARKGPGSVERGMRFLRELRRIVIDPGRCPVAAREFSLCAFARDRDGRPSGGYLDANNHTIDAVRYALERFSAARKAQTFCREQMLL